MESNNNDFGKMIRNIGLFLGIPLLIFIALWLVLDARTPADEKKYSDYLAYFRNEQVQEYDLNIGNGNLKIVLKPEFITEDTNRDGKLDEKDILKYQVPDVSLFVQDLRDIFERKTDADAAYVPPANDYEPASQLPWILNLLPSLLIVVVFIVMIVMVRRSMSSIDGGKTMGFGKARIKQPSEDKRKTTFADVAGADEEKEELREIVDFLKSPKKFKELGARVPKGVLLVGPPGTGKTLLARAVAGEAGVPFFSISGSDFVEMYVGVGASRVRDLFDQAKKNSPCIIFIDEIDAVGRQRGAGLGGGHDEREQTLNQLLVEMDGFTANDGVIVIAATNRADILDKALLRPGRFDRQIYVGLPDVRGREQILKVHTRNKPMAPDINLATIAKSTPGFTGADLENLVNEAALLAARRGKKAITQSEIEEASIKVIAGPEKKSRVITPKERRLTAYHEGGHAIATYYSKTGDPVHQITIVPRGAAGGFTMSLPEEDTNYTTKSQMEDEIVILLGGRVAEKLVLDDISTGASNDLERATAIARAMVTRYGFSDRLGPVVYGSDPSETFLGRDFSQGRGFSETVAAEIDSEMRELIDDAYDECAGILTEHMDQLHKVAEALLERETLSGEEFKAIMEGRELPPPKEEQSKKDAADGQKSPVDAAEPRHEQAEESGAPMPPPLTQNEENQ